MPDFPGLRATPNYLCTLSGNSVAAPAGDIGSIASITWVANLAIYTPFILVAPFVLNRFTIFTASSANTPHYDIGVYSFSGEKIISSGSTVKSVSAGIQYITVTKTLLLPGRYYWGFAVDSALANSVEGSSASFTAGILAIAGVLEEATAFPLPAKMTPGRVTHVLMPIVGMTST